MDFVSRYSAHIPDEQGRIHYTEEEHKVWRILFERQTKLLPKHACNEFIQGLDLLGLTADTIPQLSDISRRLKSLTGWEVAPVPALISARAFFELLSERRFPAATFIRFIDELDYVKEPDIFHELFGHCPMLTDPVYANFLYNFAQKVLSHPESDWPLFQRIFWYTVEFGLIQTKDGVRIYGGGILSSISETVYSVESDLAMRIMFDPLVAFRMPYRIDSLQRAYFVIYDYHQLYQFIESNMDDLLKRARLLGEYPPLFEVDANNPNIHIHAC